jgi:hypothetical protein
MKKNHDPIVQMLNDLWNSWFKTPTEDCGLLLLDFLQNEHNHHHFQVLAEQMPKPHPIVSFDLAYIAACLDLYGWLKNGCDPKQTIAPSEFIADVAKWVNYKD